MGVELKNQQLGEKHKSTPNHHQGLGLYQTSGDCACHEHLHVAAPNHQCSGETTADEVFIARGRVQGSSSLGILRHFQVNQLEAWGYKVLPTVEKTLVCGDKGLGAMAEVNTIVDEVKSQVSLNAQKNQASS